LFHAASNLSLSLRSVLDNQHKDAAAAQPTVLTAGRPTPFERSVDVGLCKSGIDPGPDFLTQLLLPFDVGHQHLIRFSRCESIS
jgi:hypothetical protein